VELPVRARAAVVLGRLAFEVVRRAAATLLVRPVARRARVAAVRLARFVRAFTLDPARFVLWVARRVTRSPRFSAESTAFIARVRTVPSALATSSTASRSFSIAASTVPTAAYATPLVCRAIIVASFHLDIDLPAEPRAKPLSAYERT
jgi:hypothetical protein